MPKAKTTTRKTSKSSRQATDQAATRSRPGEKPGKHASKAASPSSTPDDGEGGLGGIARDGVPILGHANGLETNDLRLPENRPAGKKSRPAGKENRPAGKADRPAGKVDRPVGQSDQPVGQFDQPVGQVDDQASDQSVWRSRIVGHDRVDPASLVPNPMNFRTHPEAQRAALSDAIDEIGFLRSVTVNRRTGNIVDGHERVWQALHRDQPWIDIEYVDLSPEEEAKALATMDPISEMARVDGVKLDVLLQDVATNSDALNAMLEDLRARSVIPPDADGFEFDESVVDEVLMCTCPKCGHEFPK